MLNIYTDKIEVNIKVFAISAENSNRDARDVLQETDNQSAQRFSQSALDAEREYDRGVRDYDRHRMAWNGT